MWLLCSLRSGNSSSADSLFSVSWAKQLELHRGGLGGETRSSAGTGSNKAVRAALRVSQCKYLLRIPERYADAKRGFAPNTRRLVFTWVIDPGLDHIIQGKSAGRLFAPQPLVDGASQDLRHMVVVFAEVRKLLIRAELQLQLVVRVTERHGRSLGGGWRQDTVKELLTGQHGKRPQTDTEMADFILHDL